MRNFQKPLLAMALIAGVASLPTVSHAGTVHDGSVGNQFDLTSTSLSTLLGTFETSLLTPLENLNSKLSTTPDDNLSVVVKADTAEFELGHVALFLDLSDFGSGATTHSGGDQDDRAEGSKGDWSRHMPIPVGPYWDDGHRFEPKNDDPSPVPLPSSELLLASGLVLGLLGVELATRRRSER